MVTILKDVKFSVNTLIPYGNKTNIYSMDTSTSFLFLV